MALTLQEINKIRTAAGREPLTEPGVTPVKASSTLPTGNLPKQNVLPQATMTSANTPLNQRIAAIPTRQASTTNDTSIPLSQRLQGKPGFLDKIKQEANKLSTNYQINVGQAEARQARGEQTGLETAAQTFGEAARAGVSTLLSPLTVGVGEILNATGVTQSAEEKAKATQTYIAEQKAKNPNYNPETDPKLNPFTAGVVQSAQNSPYQERQLSEREKANMGIFTNVGGAAMDVAGALEGVGALKTAAGATAKGIASGAKATIAAGKDLPGSIKNITKSINDIGRTPKTLEGVVGEIAQGTTETINPVKTALGVVDTSKVNTYSDLLGQINKTIPEIATKVDSEFLKDTTRYTLDDLAVKQATKGGTKVSTDYVSKGLNELKDFYTAVGDDVAKTDIEDLITKAKTEGLTRKEVNDIARLHGRELNAYNANGQLASGLTKQAVENTRQGLKNTARQGIGEEAKNLDSQLSALYDTQKLIEKNVERVNKLQQLVQDRGLIEKVGYNFAKYADILTGGTLRGVIGGLLPRGAGYKTMNALDLEEKLRDNLNIVEKALKSKTDKELIDNLNQLKSSAETSARSNSSLVKNTTNSTKATTKNVIMKETIPQTKKGASGKMSGFAQITKDIPKELQPLAEEARKYKTAEEFVKAQGEPVYHGTQAKFDKFDSKFATDAEGRKLNLGWGKGNFYFTTKKGEALKYATRERSPEVAKLYLKGEPNVVEAFVDIKNPFDIGSAKNAERWRKVRDGYWSDGVSDFNYHKIPKGKTKAEAFVEQLKKEGYDGIIDGQEITAFSESSIKTKSQLTDIWKKANQSAPDPLTQEARKYKSAEEFVKAQGGVGDSIGQAILKKVELDKITDDLSKKANSFRDGGLVVDLKNPEFVKVKDELNRKMAELKNFNNSPLGKLVAEEINKQKDFNLRKKLRTGDFYTKSELIDLWNKANGNTKAGFAGLGFLPKAAIGTAVGTGALKAGIEYKKNDKKSK